MSHVVVWWHVFFDKIEMPWEEWTNSMPRKDFRFPWSLILKLMSRFDFNFCISPITWKVVRKVSMKPWEGSILGVWHSGTVELKQCYKRGDPYSHCVKVLCGYVVSMSFVTMNVWPIDSFEPRSRPNFPNRETPPLNHSRLRVEGKRKLIDLLLFYFKHLILFDPYYKK